MPRKRTKTDNRTQNGQGKPKRTILRKLSVFQTQWQPWHKILAPKLTFFTTKNNIFASLGSVNLLSIFVCDLHRWVTSTRKIRVLTRTPNFENLLLELVTSTCYPCMAILHDHYCKIDCV